jgi:hypothetical protein
MIKKKRYLELAKEVKRFNGNRKILLEIFLKENHLKTTEILTTGFIITTLEEEPFEEDEEYIIYNVENEIKTKSLFSHLAKIMGNLQENRRLLEGKINYTPEELEDLGKLFDHVRILVTELKVPPHKRAGLFFMAEDPEIISQFEELVNQLYSASNQQ